MKVVKDWEHSAQFAIFVILLPSDKMSIKLGCLSARKGETYF
jgi:hypothetical protein